MMHVKSLLKVTIGEMLKQSASENQVSSKGLRRDDKKKQKHRHAVLNRWKKLIRGATSCEGLVAFGDAGR